MAGLHEWWKGSAMAPRWKGTIFPRSDATDGDFDSGRGILTPTWPGASAVRLGVHKSFPFRTTVLFIRGVQRRATLSVPSTAICGHIRTRRQSHYGCSQLDGSTKAINSNSWNRGCRTQIGIDPLRDAGDDLRQRLDIRDLRVEVHDTGTQRIPALDDRVGHEYLAATLESIE